MKTKQLTPNKTLVSALLLTTLTLTPLQYTAADSTALRDNSVSSDTNFSNFDGINLTIDIPAYPMVGEYRFLKIYIDQNQTLFLGSVDPFQEFSLPIHKLKNTDQITVELFSESEYDETIIIAAETLVNQ